MRRRTLLAVAAATGALLVSGPLAPAHADTVPGAPTRLLAIGYVHAVRLGWFAPEDDGGSPVTGYRLRDTVSGATWTVPADIQPRTITGLPNGVPTAFRVAAINALGTGPESASAAATPHAVFAGATWTGTGGMITARSRAEAVRLRDGRVLVVGGSQVDPATGADTMLASAELYTPATGTWTAAKPVPAARSAFSLTLLPSGMVLLAGGYDPTFTPRRDAYLYDPSANTWKITGSLRRPRASHVGVGLRGGAVLAAGGTSTAGSSLAVTRTSETYDPATGSWTLAGAMTRPRTHSMGARLLGPAGLVLVAGGDAGGAGTRTAEQYRPWTRSWAATGSMHDVRGNDDVGAFTMTLLPDGRVLVAGGYGTAGVLRSAELYTPATGAWSGTGSMRFGREGGHTATLLPSGRVLVTGGLDDYGGLAVAETYVPSTGAWQRVNDLQTDRFFHTATLLPGGNVLVAGGVRTVPLATLASAERYG